MNSRDFCFWLQGFFEIGNPSTLDAHEVEIIKQHLGLVFRHDPNIDQKACEHSGVAVPDPRDVALSFRDVLRREPSLFIC